jgi:hypothetical protein
MEKTTNRETWPHYTEEQLVVLRDFFTEERLRPAPAIKTNAFDATPSSLFLGHIGCDFALTRLHR